MGLNTALVVDGPALADGSGSLLLGMRGRQTSSCSSSSEHKHGKSDGHNAQEEGENEDGGGATYTTGITAGLLHGVIIHAYILRRWHGGHDDPLMSNVLASIKK